MDSNASNRNFILIFAVISIGFLIYGVLNFNKAFHQVGINFQVTRADALEIATAFLAGQNHSVVGFKNSVVFTHEGGDKLYLEKELGIGRMTSLAKDSLEIWFWRVRFFKPLQKLEYEVYVNPKGKVVIFQRLIEDEAAAPSLDKDVAMIIAEQFIVNKMKVDLDNWELVQSSSEDLPNRRDHSFEFEQKDFKARDAEYRMKVGIQGAEASFFRRYLNEPDSWWREWRQQRSQNELFQNIAKFLASLMFIGVFIYFFKHVKKKQIPWKTTLGFGIALAIAQFVMGLNSLPLNFAFYDTTQSYSSFVGMRILLHLVNGISLGMMLVLLFGAGEYLYRTDYPNKQYLPSFFTRLGSRTRNFFQATIMGYLLAGFHIGFVVMFYIVGEKFGAWSPTDVKYSNSVSTPFPWIYPLAISMYAALTEEFWFRLFGISFIKRITKSTWLAIIIPAFIWGFLHSSYPQQPGFVRGIEVGLIGIVAGVVMLRFGLWATLTWHFVIDAVLIGMFLFQSDNAYFWTSGLIVCGGLAIPGIIALMHYIRYRKFEPADEILNKAIKQPDPFKPEKMTDEIVTLEPLTDTIKSEPRELAYTPLSAKIKRIALIVGIVGILIALIPGPSQFGEEFSFDIHRDQAIQMGKDALHDRYGVDPDAFMTAVTIYLEDKKSYNDSRAYLKKYGSIEDAKRILNNREGILFVKYSIKFMKDGIDEWYNVHIYGENDLNVWHILPDSATGAQLELDSAKVLATEAFYKAEPFPEQYQLIEDRSIQHDNRIDYNFKWETIEPVIEEAHYRRLIRLVGDEVLVGTRSLQIPEEFKRLEEKRTFRNVIGMVVMMIFVLGGGILAVIIFSKRMIKHQVRWRAGLIVGGITLFFGGLSIFNDWANVWKDYNTSEPIANYISGILIQGVIEIFGMVGLVIVVVSLIEALIKEYYNSSCWTGLGKGDRTATYDGLIAMFGVVGAWLGTAWLKSFFTSWLNMPVHAFELGVSESLAGINSFMPWLAQLIFNSNAILAGSLMMIVLIVINQSLKKTIVRRISFVAGSIVIALAVGMVNGNNTFGEVAWQSTQIFVSIMVGYATLKYFVRGRLWVVILSLFFMDSIKVAMQFIGWENSPYNLDGWILLGVGLMVVMWIAWRGLKAPKTA